MYKVFINDSSITFTNTASVEEKTTIYESSIQLKDLFHAIEQNENKVNVVVLGENLNLMWEDFKSHFAIVEAAGGVVRDVKNRILLIHRLGKWDLPKGKVEFEEEIESAAKREVEEECGLDGLQILKRLNNTYHTYSLKGQPILKPTYWYEMKTSFNGELVPQLEEDIHEVKWVEAKDMDFYIDNTYSSIASLLETYLKNERL